MNRLTCEMCNSTDMVKQDGFFICQSCGTKYSLEEAKKMMIEGTVDIQGTVKVDNSSFVEKFIANARRAKEKGDWEEVEKYYNKVEENDPQNIEAIFYSAYGKAMLSLSDGDKFKRKQKFEVLNNSISIIDDFYDTSKSEELTKIISNISTDIIIMSQSSFVYNKTRENNISVDDRNETYQLFSLSEYLFIKTLENIIKKDPSNTKLYRILINHYKRIIVDVLINAKIANALREDMQKAMEKLKQLDPSYVIEELPPKRKSAFLINLISFAVTFIVLSLIILLIFNIL